MASTDVGKNNGILDYTDFDPLSQGALWPQAYEEIIDRNYGNILSKNTTISRSENSDYIAPSDNRLGLSTDRINIGITPGYGYSDISEGITPSSGTRWLRRCTPPCASWNLTASWL